MILSDKIRYLEFWQARANMSKIECEAALDKEDLTDEQKFELFRSNLRWDEDLYVLGIVIDLLRNNSTSYAVFNAPKEPLQEKKKSDFMVL